MLNNNYKQITISEHTKLYDRIIPREHFLRKLNEQVDFSFVNKLVEKEYCEKLGRPAKEPEMMYKLLFLQIKDLLSDREVVEKAKVDMSYKYFLGLNPEDEVVSYSLLSVFRNTKIKDETILEEMLQETVKQAIDKGIIKSNSIIVDSAHTHGKGEKKTPTQILRELSKKLRKEIYRTEPEIKECFPDKVEATATLEEEIEYTKELIKRVGEKITEKTDEKIVKRYKKVKEMVESDKLKEIQSVSDEDARQGYKSEDNDFFGYKNHVAMTPERIVTGIEVTSGEAPDGKYLQDLVKKSKDAGIDVKEVIGDTAYAGKDNLDYAEEEEIKIIAKMNPSISKSQNKEDGFEYIKDADTMRCPAGELAIRKRRRNELINNKGNYENARIEYEFDVEKCKGCAKREGCYKEGSKSKNYSVAILSDSHKKQQEFEKTEYFEEKLKKERYKIEAKNAETKVTHGLSEARYVGLSRMRIQSYLTHIVTNIKRIVKLTEAIPAQ
ncbi:MAG: IS1182 family transposase [Firmicutes bacterium]|nr:IS1182 family transposase [Bacillota bacterium]